MLILNAVVNGILYGGVLAVLAFGLNLMFGVLEVVHFFYGQAVMVGLYVVYALVMWGGLPPFPACLIAVVFVTLLNVLSHLTVVRPLLKAPMLNQFLAMASVMIILENACLIIFGAGYKGIPINLPVINIGELYLRTSNLIAFLGSLIALGSLYLLLRKTYIGLAMQAVAQDREAAKLMSINPEVIYFVTMVVGGALAGIAAVFFVPIYAVHPHFGGSFTLAAFVTVVLGGMGNLFGGFLAAFIIGLVTMLVSALSSAELGEMAGLFIFVAVILIRPQGIMGQRSGI
jgi:branched-chain amino acid transport system permease protein